MGIKVYSHQEAYLDPSLPFYESIIALLADVARWERVRRSERTKAGLEKARKAGKRLGRPPGSKDSRKRVVKRRSWVGVPVPLGGQRNDYQTAAASSASRWCGRSFSGHSL